MTDRTLDIALRIKADLASAAAGVEKLQGSLSGTAQQADTTGTAVGRAGQRMDALLVSVSQMVQVLQSMDQRLAATASHSGEAAAATEQVARASQDAAQSVQQLATAETAVAAQAEGVVATTREQAAAEQAAASASKTAASSAQALGQAESQVASQRRDAAAAAREKASGEQGAAASAKATSAALQAQGESEAQAAVRIRDMVAASVAQQRALDDAVAASTRAASASQTSEQATQRDAAARAASAAQYQRQRDAVVEFMAEASRAQAILETQAASLADVASRQATLDTALERGAITEDEYAQGTVSLVQQQQRLRAEMDQLLARYAPAQTALERLNADQGKLEAAQRSGAISADQFAKAMVGIQDKRDALEGPAESAHKLSLNSSMARREMGLLAKDIATGQWGRFEQSALTLANATGLIGAAFTPMGAGIALGVAAVGMLVAAVVKGYTEEHELNRAIEATGNYASTSSANLQSLIGTLGATSGSFSTARSAVTQLAASGRVGADSLGDAARAAVAMAQLTDQSIDQAVQHIVRLQEDPVRAIQELDKQYHFLQTTTYQQIAVLQRQGQESEAAALAQRTLANALEQRRQRDVENLGTIERAWRSVSTAVQDYWEKLKNLGRTDNAAQLSYYEGKRNEIQSDDVHPNGYQYVDGKAFKGQQAAIAYIDQQVGSLKNLQAASDNAAAAERVRNRVQSEGNEGAAYIDALVGSLDKAVERQNALNKAATALYNTHLAGGKLPDGVNFNGPVADEPQGPGWDRIRTEINKRYADPKVKDTSNALAEAQKQLQEQILGLGNTALGPVTAIWDKYTKAMIDASAAGGKAIKAGGDIAQVQEQVSKIQELAATARDKALADQQQKVQIGLMQATGDQAGAAKLQFQAQYGDLLADLERRSDTAGVALVKKLINVSEAQSQLQALQQQVQAILADQSRQEQNIQAEQAAGLISEYTARQRILDLHLATGNALDGLIPKYRELTDVSGNPRDVEALRNVEAEVARLKLQTNDAKAAFDSGLTSGLEQSLEGLANRTMTVGQAFRNLATTVTASLAQVAARAIATQAINGLKSLAGGGDQTNDVGQGAAKLAVAGGAVGAAAVAIGVNAAALQAAATTLLIANTAKSASLFAEGGFTGPGGKYDVAGVVHAGEYVQPAFRLAQPGALAFMRDFHTQGMDAIDRWAMRGYANGGLVSGLSGVPAPSRLPSPSLPRFNAPALAGGVPQISFRAVNQVDPALFGDYLDSADGEAVFLNLISRNGATIKQRIGG
ncbi:MAG: hypothetical protein GAK28_00690 [Luteibacter sp.]|uniref:phage tail length tape measure family protein n=1 Tax=Luteibacter sp. TaxID=1886636 RepID=UPI00137CA071|nr:phage tail length tape measure family protein [Luteibacter sp.]KAF1009057.1 MAG: hypothetical protein GAK28_00690 [Luteibacter sp.]